MPEDRGRPLLALAFTDGRMPKRYATKRSAYYQLAKNAVLAKYPPWLDYQDDVMREEYRAEGWTAELVEVRREKSAELFANPDGGWFDQRRWRHVIQRVARFMMFVDSRRELAEHLRTRETAELHRMWTTRERWLSDLAGEMTAIKNVIDDRERAAGHR